MQFAIHSMCKTSESTHRALLHLHKLSGAQGSDSAVMQHAPQLLQRALLPHHGGVPVDPPLQLYAVLHHLSQKCQLTSWANHLLRGACKSMVLLEPILHAVHARFDKYFLRLPEGGQFPYNPQEIACMERPLMQPGAMQTLQLIFSRHLG